MFHKTRSWESDSEAPQTPQSPQERCRKPLARLPPLIQWALASQMTQQMFTFVVIAFDPKLHVSWPVTPWTPPRGWCPRSGNRASGPSPRRTRRTAALPVASEAPLLP